MFSTKRKRFTSRAIAMFLICCLVICGIHTDVMAKNKKLKSINSVVLKIGSKKVTKKTYNLKAGDKKKITVSVLPNKAKKTVKYFSDNKKAVTVDKNGTITAKQIGTSKVSVSVSANGYKKKTVWVRIKVTKAANIPEVTEKPAATKAPQIPEISSEPSETAAPIPTLEPSENPAQTVMPTQMPETSGNPIQTATPTQVPEISGNPVQTVEPTKVPEGTNEPVATETPSSEPAQTAEPANTPVATSEPVATATPSPAVEPTVTPTVKKNIVIYFSCTDNTKKIAEYAAESMDADIYRIEAAVPYTTADLNYNDSNSRTSIENRNSTARPEIAGVLPSLDEYTNIYIGYPIWHGQAPKIMYTFVENYNLSGKNIVPFCTSASSGIGTSATNLQSAANWQSTWLTGRRFSGSASKSDIESWISEMNLE